MATKADIAKLAGVSPATVSNFYKGTKKIGLDVQKRIIDAANSLGYSLPDIKNNSRDTISVVLVVDDILNPHYGSILKGMSSVATTMSASVSMMLIWDDVDEFCQMLINQRVFAVYFATYIHNITQQNLDALKSKGIEVFFSWNNFIIDFDSLLLKSVKYLVDLGHKDIAYLSGLSINNSENTRYNAFLKAMDVCGLTVTSDHIIDGIFPYYADSKSGYWAMKSHLENNAKITAVIALNDLLAIGAMNAIYEKGLKVPDDISVIGCDDIMISEYLNPPLTTLRFSANDIGARIMYAIFQHSKNLKNLPVSLQTNLVIRKSTGRSKL